MDCQKKIIFWSMLSHLSGGCFLSLLMSHDPASFLNINSRILSVALTVRVYPFILLGGRGK